MKNKILYLFLETAALFFCCPEYDLYTACLWLFTKSDIVPTSINIATHGDIPSGFKRSPRLKRCLMGLYISQKFQIKNLHILSFSSQREIYDRQKSCKQVNTFNILNILAGFQTADLIKEALFFKLGNSFELIFHVSLTCSPTQCEPNICKSSIPKC